MKLDERPDQHCQDLQSSESSPRILLVVNGGKVLHCGAYCMLQSQAVEDEPTVEKEKIWKAKQTSREVGRGIYISKKTLSCAMNT